MVYPKVSKTKKEEEFEHDGTTYKVRFKTLGFKMYSRLASKCSTLDTRTGQTKTDAEKFNDMLVNESEVDIDGERINAVNLTDMEPEFGGKLLLLIGGEYEKKSDRQ